MHFRSSFLVAATMALGAIAAPTTSHLFMRPKDIYAARATAKTLSSTSNVKGKFFDRYVSIWFENTDYEMAAADPNFHYFAHKGQILENFVCESHPSEPNYMAVASGDYFGLNGDPFIAVPQNVSTVVDLLEDKNISWGYYQEDLPYSGYEGFKWNNQETGANAYVRKHNPGIIFDSVSQNANRAAHIKNTTMFFEDLKNDQLPQWMFITPNMTSDGHDTSVTVAGQWLRDFLDPLLHDEKFMKNTLVLVTFDENETYSIQNRVFSILLGDVVPKSLANTIDSNYYNHYSELATVQANWGLHTLGRWDVGANVFQMVAKHTGDTVRGWNEDVAGKFLSERFFNYSQPGIYNSKEWAPQPVPDVTASVNGRTVLPSIVKTWETKGYETYYTGQLEIPDGLNRPEYPDEY